MNRNALLNAIGIFGVLAGTTVCVALGILHPIAYLLAIAACAPMAKYLWAYAKYLHHNPIRILQKLLPKIGFKIENTEWNDNHSAVRFHGIFREENFFVEASDSTYFIDILDCAWQTVPATDKMIPRLMEAVNEVNARSSNMSVVVGEPAEDGLRRIYTTCRTIIDMRYPEEYMETLMCDMLNCKGRLSESLKKERPYMEPRRSPMGFQTTTADDDSAESAAPAAKNDSTMKN